MEKERQELLGRIYRAYIRGLQVDLETAVAVELELRAGGSQHNRPDQSFLRIQKHARAAVADCQAGPHQEVKEIVHNK